MPRNHAGCPDVVGSPLLLCHGDRSPRPDYAILNRRQTEESCGRRNLDQVGQSRLECALDLDDVSDALLQMVDLGKNIRGHGPRCVLELHVAMKPRTASQTIPSSRGLRLGYISRKRHSFTDYR